jgi:hypothetical protein
MRCCGEVREIEWDGANFKFEADCSQPEDGSALAQMRQQNPGQEKKS